MEIIEPDHCRHNDSLVRNGLYDVVFNFVDFDFVFLNTSSSISSGLPSYLVLHLILDRLI